MVFPPISIHAPPRGATIAADTARLATFKFQFTPLREGRHAASSMIVAPIGFQFTPLREGRRKAAQEIQRGGAISIHAPPRGATWSFPPSRDYPTFQFTPLREGRRKTKTHFWRASTFQFTPLREGRRGAFRHHGITLHFNSRPSARGDRQGNPRWATETISIHAPPRGATKFAWISLLREHFNSRPSARGDGLVMPRMPSLLFQFTPLREGRHKAKFEGMRLTDISIHAPPRGATQ